MNSRPEPPKCVRIVRETEVSAEFPDNPARAYGHKKPFPPPSLSIQAGTSRAREQDCQDLRRPTEEARPRGLYRAALPSGGRQWSWSTSDPLVHRSLRLPVSLLAKAEDAARWRDIPAASVLRRAFEIGLEILLDTIAEEDADKASAK